MRSATLLASLFSFAWAAVALAADRPSGSQTVSVAGSQPAAKGAAEYFTGNVRVDPLFAAKDTAPFSGAYVTFEPGARSAWHTHPAGQHLIVTSGAGEADRDINDRIDAAYQSKYRRHGGRYVDPMVALTARATTIKLVPRSNIA